MGGSVLEEVDSYKHLGVTLSNDLTWTKHIENIATNAGKCLDILNALKYKLDRYTLEKLYKSFVRSKLEYANIIWDNCSKQMADLLESVQYRAAKIISGAINRTSHNIVYQEMGWETLGERRKRQRLKVMYKTMNHLAPSYLQQNIRTNANANARYELRHEHNIGTYRARTSSFHNSFFPQTIREWNNLDTDIKAAGTLDTFTSKLTICHPPVPKWYYKGDRTLSILHAKMRMLCSNLNDHLYSHIHVVDSPKCQCGFQRENNKHFLLDCPLFINERQDLLNKLTAISFQPTVSNLLYGNKEYTDECNIQAFNHIHDFIKQSGRFD